MTLSRRQFARDCLPLPLLALVPAGLFGVLPKRQRVLVRADSPVGVIRPELHGQFAEHVGSCIYGGLWVGRDSPIANLQGYRKQAIDYLRELGVPVLRWPGGCFADDYHWRDGIGPAAKRPRRVNLHWGDYTEDNSFGTHEFIGLCRAIGAEPYICGNVGSGSPEELRDWIEYCNYPAGSTLAGERTANGSPAPFRVRYWGVGNENWGCGGAMTAKQYVDLFRRFAVFAGAFGGVKPFLVACGPNRNDTSWTRDFMAGAGHRPPDGFAMHYYAEGGSPSTAYTPQTMSAQFATFAGIEQAVTEQRALLDSYQPGAQTGLIIDEWGVHDRLVPAEEKRYGRLWQESTLRSAIAIALGLNLFNRQAGKLYMCNLAQMVNVRAPLLQTDGPEGRQCIRTTVYYAFSLFKAHRSKTAVRVETEQSSSASLSVSASRGEKQLVVSFVNPDPNDDMQVDCSIDGAEPRSGAGEILHDDDFNAYNSFDDPQRIAPRHHPVSLAGSSLRIDLPRLSLVTATLTV